MVLVEYLIFSNFLSTATLSLCLGFFIYVLIFCCKPSSKKALPSLNCSILGSTLFFIKSVLILTRHSMDHSLYILLQGINGCIQLYGKDGLFHFRTIFKSGVFFYKPETVEVILRSTVDIHKSSYPYAFFHDWIGNGVLVSVGQKWHTRRKLLTPSFHFRILKEMMKIFNGQSEVLVAILYRMQSQWVNIMPMATYFSLDVICESAMGLSINAQNNGFKRYTHAIHRIGNISLIRPGRPWLIPDKIFKKSSMGKKFYGYLKVVNDVTKELIKKKKEELINQGKYKSENKNDKDLNSMNPRKPGTFLELLLKYHLTDPLFTEKDIIDEINTFMFAGHDTSSMTLGFTLYCLGLEENRSIQTKVHEELDSIFNGDVKGKISWEEVNCMKYLERVIKESMRLFPTVPIIGREAKRTIEVGDYTVEKGNMCFVNLMVLHRDPSSFPDPEKFDPDRFLPENVAKRHNYAYVPFSAGARNCIGQKFALVELKTVLANVLRNFTVTSKDPRDKINILANIAIKNLEPVMLQFTPRSYPENQT